MACYLYLIQEQKKRGAIKIGIASNVEDRLNNLQIGNPNKLKTLFTYEAKSRKHAYALENWVHRTFKKKRLNGEWFKHDIELKRIFGKIEKDPTGF